MNDILHPHCYSLSKITYDSICAMVPTTLAELSKALEKRRFHVGDLDESGSTLSHLVMDSMDHLLGSTAHFKLVELRALAIRLYLNALGEKLPEAFFAPSRSQSTAIYIPKETICDLMNRCLDGDEEDWQASSDNNQVDGEDYDPIADAISGYREVTPTYLIDSYPRLITIASQEWVDGKKMFYRPSILRFMDSLAAATAVEIAAVLRDKQFTAQNVQNGLPKQALHMLTENLAIFPRPLEVKHYLFKIGVHLIPLVPSDLTEISEDRISLLNSFAAQIETDLMACVHLNEEVREALPRLSVSGSMKITPELLRTRRLADEAESANAAMKFISSLGKRARPGP